MALDAGGNLYVADTDNSTIRKLTSNGVVSTLAGLAGQTGSADGVGSAARFNKPAAVVVDPSGNLYVTDSGNGKIRKITAAGEVTSLTSGGALLTGAQGITLDGDGNLYVANPEKFIIAKVAPDGTVSLLAGVPGVPASTNGQGTLARFDGPNGITLGSSGLLYVTDTTKIRTVTRGGLVNSLGSATFAKAKAVVADHDYNICIADTGNHQIRQMTDGGTVTLIAGSFMQPGSVDGAGSAARFYAPSGVATDYNSTFFVGDTLNMTIRKINSAKAVTTFAGRVVESGNLNATGSAARFSFPGGVAVDRDGNLFVADSSNFTIRKISSGGVVTAFAGTPGQSGSTNGSGTGAKFGSPRQLAVDTAGNVYVADALNQTIRKITPDGVVSTFAGSSGQRGSADGIGGAARFSNPNAVAVDASGNVYVADYFNYTIRKISPDAVVTTLAGSAGQLGSNDGAGSEARFYEPLGVAVDGGGNVYVADFNNHTIRKITADGVVTTLAGSAGQPGSVDGTGSAARFYHPNGVAVDADGNVYVTDSGNHTIRKVTSIGVVTTIGGRSGLFGNQPGIGTAALFFEANAVAVGGDGKVYVAGNRNHNIVIGSPGPAPDVTLEQPVGSSLVTGSGKVDFGAVALSGPGSTRTFKVKNDGNLDLTALGVSIDGSASTDFVVTTALTTTTLAPGAGTTFTVTFTPSVIGSRSATLHLISNDPDEAPFDVTLTGSTPDVTPPLLSPVTMVSDSSTYPGRGRIGSTVTVAFTANETIQIPTMTIAGKTATVTNPSGNNWTGTVTASAGDPQGQVAFTIAYRDLAGNSGTAVSDTTDGSSVMLDFATEPPTLDYPVAGSGNRAPFYIAFRCPEAVLDDSMTLTFVGAETRVLKFANRLVGTIQGPFDPANPTAFSNVVGIEGGTTIPDGTYTVTLSYRDLLGNDPASASVSGVTIDTVTLPPALTVPQAGALKGSNAMIAFTLPEAADSAVTVTFDPGFGSGVRTLYLGSTLESPGTYSIAFSPSGPVATANPSGAIAYMEGGTSIPDGTYTVTVRYYDWLDNAPGRASAANVVIDTIAPALELSDDMVVEAEGANGARVSYAASASDPGGSGVATSSFIPTSGSVFPLGTTTVNASATDGAGNVGTGSFRISVRDTTAPAATADLVSLTAGPTGKVRVGDQRTAVHATDRVTAEANLLIEQTPNAATELGLGTHTLSFKISDAAGNFTTVQTTATVAFARPSDPEQALVEKAGPVVRGLATGESVPSTVGLPDGSTFGAFFTPALSDARRVVARATVLAGRTRLQAIYAEDGDGRGEILAFQNGFAPDETGQDSLPNVTFKSFLDPIIAPGGSVAFSAKLQGAGAKTGDDGVWTNAFGPLALVLREGSAVPDLPTGVKVKAVTSLSLRDGSVVAMVKLNPLKGAVIAGRDDVALVALNGLGTGKLLLRTGMDFGGSTVKTIASLAPALGSPGHGRWHGGNAVLAKVTLASKEVQLVQIAFDGTPMPILSSLDEASAIDADARWTNFGLPAMDGAGTQFAVAATLQQKLAGVTAKNDVALISSSDGVAWSAFARESDLTPISASSDGPRYANFFDPVTNEAGQIAFLATLQGAGISAKNKTGLFCGTTDHLGVAARLGDPAPDEQGTTEGGSVWTKFISYALPGGGDAGLVFIAETAGGDTPAKGKLALWAVDSHHQVRRLLRTGIPLNGNGPVLTSLRLLEAAAGSFGSARSYNSSGSVAVLATFADKTQTLLRVDVP